MVKELVKISFLNQGLYEELVTTLITFKLSELDKETFQVKTTKIDKADAAQLPFPHIGKTTRIRLEMICEKVYLI